VFPRETVLYTKSPVTLALEIVQTLYVFIAEVAFLTHFTITEEKKRI
jgi:hypothetical protein